MATVLKNVLTFTGLAVGVPASLPHLLNVHGVPVKPHLVLPQVGGFFVIADQNNVTVTRLASGGSSVEVYVEHWHTIEDAEPPGSLGTLTPYILQPGNSGTGQVAISAGTQVAQTGTVVFSNSNNISFGMSNNSVVTASAALGGIAAGTQTGTAGTILFSNASGVSFGMNNSSVVTATVDGIKAISASNAEVSNGAVFFSNGGGVTFGIVGSTITASVQTVGGTASGIAMIVGTATQSTGAVVLSNSNNVSVGYSASTITFSAAFGGIAAGTQTGTAGTIVLSNSNSVTFGMSNNSVITASFYQPSIQKVVGYTATGGETDFSVTMAAVANTNYDVFAGLAGVSLMPILDMPLGTANRALTAFRVVPSGTLSTGDVLRFFIFAS
jgi:hypothetical protein